LQVFAIDVQGTSITPPAKNENENETEIVNEILNGNNGNGNGNGIGKDVLLVVDVSGSMAGTEPQLCQTILEVGT
jgi:Mg-chelatase subunit ChlD